MAVTARSSRTARPAGPRHRSVRLPRAHWVLLALLLAALLASLLLSGYSSNQVGGSGAGRVPAGERAAPVQDSLLHASSDGKLAQHAPPRRTVVLTFDDGPDPTWTPRVLDLLDEHDVPATFFVVGAQAARHPELVRREMRDGHEVAVHTFTHAHLAGVPAWRADLEMSLSQVALAGAGGVSSALVRPPFASTPQSLSAGELASVEKLARDGYLVALSDRDTKDWQRPGVQRIVEAATPGAGEGAIVLFHDGGGDRGQTLKALQVLVPRLKAQGYRFTTVSAALGMKPHATMAEVGPVNRVQGLALLVATQVSNAVTEVLGVVLVVAGALMLARSVLLVVFARRHVRMAGARYGRGRDLPPISVIVPAFNEEVGIGRAVQSLAASDYPDLEILVVDDGSTDGTADVVENLMLPSVRIVHQVNAGKAAALNRGVALARHDIVVMVDADTVFERDTLRRLVQPFADPEVGAISGNTKVGNRRRLLGRWQHIEYVVGFNLDRRMFDLLGCMPTVPGAIGAFRRSALADVGGVGEDTLAEDTDLTMAVVRAGWKVVYEESARAWTEAPADLAALWRQRYRWCYGTLQAMWKHRGALRPGGGRMGRYGIPYLLMFQVVLPLIAPVVDVYAVYGVLFLEPASVAAYWLGFLVVQAALAGYAFRLDNESPATLWTLPLQQLVYRQLMYLVVVQSVVSALLGTRLGWHRNVRTGDVVSPPLQRA